VGRDVIDMVNGWRTAGERASLSEQWEMPGPYREAWDFIGVQMSMLRTQRAS